MLLNKNIVLVGFMGSGKSMVSRELSKKYSRKVISTDALIVEQEGVDINTIFEQKGETYFRDLEHQVVQRVSKESSVIIDCGGGVVINPNNLKCLKENGVLFYLKTTPESVLKQVSKTKNRPLLNVDNPLEVITELMDQREPFYSQADYTIESADCTIGQIFEQVIKVIEDE